MNARLSHHNKGVVQCIIEDHWSRKNDTLVGELFTPIVLLETPDGSFFGFDGALSLLQAYASAFPDFTLHINSLLAYGDYVIARWTFRGTHLGVFGDIPPSGRRVELTDGLGIFHLTAYKVDEAQLYWDRRALLHVCGTPSGRATTLSLTESR